LDAGCVFVVNDAFYKALIVAEGGRWVVAVEFVVIEDIEVRDDVAPPEEACNSGSVYS
jgi:hypothetical protein